MGHRVIIPTGKRLSIQTGARFTCCAGGLWGPGNAPARHWYDASDATTIAASGGFVSQWDNKVNGAPHLVQTDGARQPTYSGGMVHSNGSQLMVAESLPIPADGDHMMFVMFDFANSTSLGDAAISMDAVGAPNNDWQIESAGVGTFSGRMRVTGSGALVGFTGGPFNDLCVLNVNWNFTDASPHYNAFIDGTQCAVDTTYSLALNPTQTLRIFANRVGGTALSGAIGEIVIVDGVSIDIREKMEGYLAWKWGTQASLPSGHTYKNAPPTT